MPFQKGNKLAKGGARPNSGPKSRAELQAAETARELFRKIIEESSSRLANHYLRRSYKSDKVLINAADKLWPGDPKKEGSPSSIQINLINYGASSRDRDPAQLHSQELSIPVLGSNGSGDKEGVQGLAQEIGQGYHGPKLRDLVELSPAGSVLPPISDVQPGQKGNVGHDRKRR